jgi:hypothetical protein
MRTNLLALTAIVRSPVYLSPKSCIHFQKWYSAPLKLILSDLSFAVQWIGEAYVPQPYTATNTFVGALAPTVSVVANLHVSKMERSTNFLGILVRALRYTYGSPSLLITDRSCTTHAMILLAQAKRT